MSRITGLGLLAAVLAAGCGKDEKKDPPGPKGTNAPPPASDMFDHPKHDPVKKETRMEPG
ncbi:MAG: hypothetical protein JWO38_6727 [Gemmataceae bacterium]|nr:hypothetical protein [Gemmataceae bacterium]